MGDIKILTWNLEKNLLSLTEDCDFQMLVSLEKIKELEDLCKDVEVLTVTPSVVQYLDWKEEDFGFNIEMSWSMVLTQYHTPKLHEFNSYKFHFNINDIMNDGEWYYSQEKFNYINVVWSCRVGRFNDGYLDIGIVLSSCDNPRLNYCFIDGQISLLNMDDDSKTVSDTVDDERFDVGGNGGIISSGRNSQIKTMVI
ncbi:hypothetical protein LOTGIDRAFT_175660 [Lottia gigantea]|uniref:MATH domain-containing protein n=1 Tax=Lottia gigantea TaxID=225164 RepID=V3ZMU6_LOTGI|nr:hypothetical protein LOTGIDRAFT_175660 [Lottia gigantea]ESO92698.1 hypothetical protein LOTGIDRAFT_175660 [Lottia gigantea]